VNEAPFDQQPVARTVGRRQQRPPGAPPPPEDRAALDSLARRLTRAPKGVFRYGSHSEMAADRERWTVDAIVDTVRSRG
jgi:hypothetical protein